MLLVVQRFGLLELPLVRPEDEKNASRHSVHNTPRTYRYTRKISNNSIRGVPAGFTPVCLCEVPGQCPRFGNFWEWLQPLALLCSVHSIRIIPVLLRKEKQRSTVVEYLFHQ